MFCVLGACVAAALASEERACTRGLFEREFKQRFGKTYSTDDEEDAAFSNFCRNANRLSEMRQRCPRCEVTGVMDKRLDQLRSAPVRRKRGADDGENCQTTLCGSEWWFPSDIVSHESMDLREAGLISPDPRE